MERIEAAMLAESKAGHDRGQIYVIIRVEDEYVYLVDGNIRLIDKPKKKNIKHIQIIRQIQEEIGRKIINGQKLENEEVKRAIKIYLSKTKENCSSSNRR